MIPLSSYITDVLGDNHWVPISYDRANAIVAITGNQKLCYVQFPSEDCPELTSPLLWSYGAWAASVEKFRRAKERSERERVQRRIDEANIKLIMRAVMRFASVDSSQAQMLATRMILRQQFLKIEMLGVKLITKEEELP